MKLSGIIDGIRTSVVVAESCESSSSEIINRINDLNFEVEVSGTSSCDESSTDSEKIGEILSTVSQILIGVVLILDRFHIPYQG